MTVKNFLFQKTLISYSVHGTGKPVVLLHGFGEDGSIWDDQVKFLEKTYKLIIPDIPGSGKSLMPEGKATLEYFAAVINEIIKEENEKEVVLIGHSMGGYITLAFAEKYPEKLQAFGLFHSGAYADNEEKKEARKKSIKFIAVNGSGAFLSSVTPGLFYDAEKNKADIVKLSEIGEKFLPEALIQYYEAMMCRPDRTPILKQFDKPILFIIGEHDKAIPFEDSLRQSHLPAHAYIHILRNSGHMGMKEETAGVNLILAQFLQSLGTV